MKHVAVVGTIAAVAVLFTAASASSGGVRLHVLAHGGTVTAYHMHFRCRGSCSLSAAPGSVVILEARPSRFFSFSHWAGACRGKGTACVLTLKSATSARAVFTRNSSEVLVAVGGSGSVGIVGTSSAGCGTASGSCDITWPSGTAIELAATADAEGAFGGWGGACASTSGLTCRIVVGNQTTSQVLAAFATTPDAGEQQQLQVQTLNASLQSSIPGFACQAESACTATVDTGTLVKLHAHAVALSAAATWDGACVGDGPDCELVVDGPAGVTAPRAVQFGPPGKGSLHVTIAGNGVVTDGHKLYCTPARSPCDAFYAGSNPVVRLTATAKPAAGNVFNAWVGLDVPCAPKRATCTLKVDNGSGTTITAYFKRKR